MKPHQSILKEIGKNSLDHKVAYVPGDKGLHPKHHSDAQVDTQENVEVKEETSEPVMQLASSSTTAENSQVVDVKETPTTKPLETKKKNKKKS